MGLFGKNEICTICNSSESSKKLADGYICKSCMAKCQPFIFTLSWKDITEDRVKKAIAATEKNNELKKIFKPTNKIDKYIEFDGNNRLWKAVSSSIIYGYDEIISFELWEDGESITKGGLGSAIVGGAMFGGAGAIVGGVTGKKTTKKEIREYGLRIITRNEMSNQVYINFLTTGAIKSGGITYNLYKSFAQKIISELTVITDSLKVTQNTGNIPENISGAEEILKFKKLCDDGIITQEEFEAKKKQLLGL